jgi:hypothetical protein
MAPHLLRCQGFAVGNYSFTLGRLEAGVPSAFAQLGSKSLLVEADEYLLPLSRYIHLNPVRTGRFKNTDFRTKAVHLKKYPWSSFAGYCYLRKRNPSFDYSRLLNTYFGQDNSQGRRQYREYVLKGIEGEIENPFEDVLHQSILGTQDFVERIKPKMSVSNFKKRGNFLFLRSSIVFNF